MAELYEWQKKALEEALEKNKLIIQVATGAGKTFFAIELLKLLLQKNPDSRILIIVPKIVILENTWMKELMTNGFGPHQVGAYYGQAKEYSKITLTTTASVTRLNIDLFDICIIDEVHNMMTTRLMNIVKRKEFTKIIGLSATIDSTDYRHWGLLREFGFNQFTYDTKQAIDDGIISTLTFTNIGIPFDDEELHEKYDKEQQQITALNHAIRVKQYRGDNTSAERTAMYAHVNARNEIVYNYPTKLTKVIELVERNKGKKIIIFNQRNDISNQLYWMLHDVEGIRAVIVNSGVKRKQQAANIKSFANGNTNTMLASISLDEGYNLPNIDVAIILSGNATSRQAVQRIGRVLRKSVGKEEAKIYQLYLQDSCEQRHADKRAVFFKSIARVFTEET